MTPAKRLRARLHGRTDSEHEQAFLRIVIVAAVLAMAVVFHGPHDFEIVQMLSGFLALAIGIFVAICISPARNVPRRLLGMIADAGGCTWYLWVGGEYSLFVIGLYLFITFGNGFRYGRRWLFGCQALCLLGFTTTLLMVPFWIERRVEGLGLLSALIVLPLYVSTLLKRIEDARARAEDANKAKSSFLANMSHEIRTPLNGIVGVVDLFKTTELTTHQQELVQLLRHSTTVLRSLVDDVLDISKIESGRLTIEVASFDLHASVNGLVQLLRPHAASKGLTLHAAIDPELDYRLKGDSHHLRQILLNLLGNAIKFTERGEVLLAVTLSKATTEGVTARFEVRDTGIGIRADLLPQIFERFVQADQSATRRFGGSGLGTTIAKQLVELMGGTIGVNSKLGEGTTFWFEIPLLRDADIAVHQDAGGAIVGNSAEPTLLIADGEAAKSIASVLRSAGEAVDVVEASEPFGPRLDAMSFADRHIRAVVANCSVEAACTAFSATRARFADQPIALIYIANRPLSVVDSARIKSFREAVVLEGVPTSRVIANAIHAAVATIGRDASETVDLAELLCQKRASLRVLVADDNPTNQSIVSQLLGSAGHTIILAADGEQALDLYESDAPDIALLDFNMPGRNGCEVIRAIRAMEPPGVRMPAIILSASVTPEARTRAIHAGADEFVGKPFDAASLVTKVDNLASRVRRSAQPTKAANHPDRRVSPTSAVVRNLDAETSEVLNYDRLSEIEDIARNSNFTMELLRGFKSDVQSLLVRLDDSIRPGASEALTDILHALKGAAVGVGAMQLAKACNDLPPGVRNNAEKVAAAVNDIHRCAAVALAHLDTYVQRQHHVTL